MFDIEYKNLSLKILGFVGVLLIWQYTSSLYPEIVLPSVGESVGRLWNMMGHEGEWKHIGITVVRSILGFILTVGIGTLLGIVAGKIEVFDHLLYVFERIIISVPPIVFIILLLIWFGGAGLTAPVLTVFIAQVPLMYVSARQAVKTLDTKVIEMACSFHMPYYQALIKIGGMHIISFTLPAITLSLGNSWKIAIMAEVLGSPNGIGSRITNARINLETADVFAWVIVIVVLYLLFDKLLLSRLHTYTQKWR